MERQVGSRAGYRNRMMVVLSDMPAVLKLWDSFVAHRLIPGSRRKAGSCTAVFAFPVCARFPCYEVRMCVWSFLRVFLLH